LPEKPTPIGLSLSWTLIAEHLGASIAEPMLSGAESCALSPGFDATAQKKFCCLRFAENDCGTIIFGK